MILPCLIDIAQSIYCSRGNGMFGIWDKACCIVELCTFENIILEAIIDINFNIVEIQFWRINPCPIDVTLSIGYVLQTSYRGGGCDIWSSYCERQVVDIICVQSIG